MGGFRRGAGYPVGLDPSTVRTAGGGNVAPLALRKELLPKGESPSRTGLGGRTNRAGCGNPTSGGRQRPLGPEEESVERHLHKRLEKLSDELRATVTTTEDGPMLIDALLELIQVVHGVSSPQPPAAQEQQR